MDHQMTRKSEQEKLPSTNHESSDGDQTENETLQHNDKVDTSNSIVNESSASSFSSQTLVVMTLVVFLAIVIELGARLVDYTSIDCQDANIYSMTALYEDPVRQFKLKFLEQSKKTNGEYTSMEMWLEPTDNFLFPEHKHMDASESFEVLSGALTVLIDGELMECMPEEQCAIPPDTVHTWGNVLGSEPLHMVVQVRPSLNFEPYIKTVLGLANDTSLTQNSPASLGHRLSRVLQDAVIEDHYKRSVFVQRHSLVNQLVIPLLARIGKIFGYRPCYPQYF